MDMYEVISELVTAPGVTGNEDCAADVAEKYFRRFSDNVWRDCSGNVFARMGHKKPTIMLIAHIDEIGMAVTDIERSRIVRRSVSHRGFSVYTRLPAARRSGLFHCRHSRISRMQHIWHRHKRHIRNRRIHTRRLRRGCRHGTLLNSHLRSQKDVAPPKAMPANTR